MLAICEVCVCFAIFWGQKVQVKLAEIGGLGWSAWSCREDLHPVSGEEHDLHPAWLWFSISAGSRRVWFANRVFN